MDRSSLSILFILIAFSAGKNISPLLSSQSAQEIFDFLNECSKNFILGEQKDVVIVLGTTGSGKSTLTLLLKGEKLTAVETSEGSGDFVINDENSLVSPPDKSTQSQTIIPNLKVDLESNTSYYDCAGFEDSRGVSHDLAVTFLIQKLLKFSDSVKFLFVIPYSSVKIGGDRHNFKKLARHATALIKNINKYQNSIGIVVTKVDTKISNGQIVSDEKTIANIATFFNQTKSDLNSEEPELKEKIEKFIEILLMKQDNKFNRIQMVRAPTESGSFNEMPFPKQERQSIRTMLNNTLKYMQKQNDDFGYTISAESKLKVHELFVELERYLMNDVISIGNEIRTFYANQATHATDRQKLIVNLMTGYKQFAHVNATDIDLFKQQLTNATSSLQIDITIENLSQFERHVELVKFLTSVSDVTLSESFKISDGMNQVKEFMFTTKNQYAMELIKELKTNLADNILNINSEIISFYWRKENETTDVNVLREKMLSDFKVFSGIASKVPEIFTRQLVAAINSLTIPVSSNTIKLLYDHIDVVRFAETLGNNVSPVQIEIENGLNTLTQYLSVTKDWYQFSIELQNALSQYEIQKDVARFNPQALVEILDRLINQTNSNSSEIFFRDTGIVEFVNQINPQLINDMDDITINAIKLKSLKKLWQQNMFSSTISSCTPNALLIKGFNVKMSDMIHVQCPANVIKLMALNRIFIDVDVEKTDKQIQIIAPAWEIFGQRKINLYGLPGTNYNSPPPKVAHGKPGTPGQPGRSGQQGGHFIGFGDTFINSQSLTITSTGGRGGDGQIGGNGK